MVKLETIEAMLLASFKRKFEQVPELESDNVLYSRIYYDVVMRKQGRHGWHGVVACSDDFGPYGAAVDVSMSELPLTDQEITEATERMDKALAKLIDMLPNGVN